MTEGKEYITNEHVTKEMFCDWQQGKLSGQEEASFLQHIGACTFCAEQFAAWMEEDLLIEPPSYLQEEIQVRTRQLDVRTAVKMKETSKQVKLMMYSLKVGLAVVASIFLLTITTGVQNLNVQTNQRESVPVEQEKKEEKESITDKLNRGSNYITDALNQAVNGLFHIELDNTENEKN